eukprot:TRINITY_DN173_c0_g1_i3.p1 TRINITY_DN173_c0_g1~~TRINITY_DN173_c0_g1_i3.p1  ORF type:complete len:276 (+),score=75.73 TRINITY_DN173_c0_g1_i3:64-891(+)
MCIRDRYQRRVHGIIVIQMSKTKEEYLFLARMSEQAERYDEMVEYAIEFTKKTKGELTLDERNILSVAFKNAVGSRRASWRVLTSVEQKEEKKEKGQVEKVRKYKQIIEKELKDFCEKVLGLVDHTLIPSTTSEETKVFYHKMKGDYCRYLAEFQKGEAKDGSSNKALEAYQAAYTLAETKLASTHPIRLGLALNFSVFYYEIMQQADKAVEMAKKSFDEAIANLDNVTDESYKDATLIMQLLRDNLTLWNSDAPEEQQSLTRNESLNILSLIHI